jgi:hypothetical protein
MRILTTRDFAGNKIPRKQDFRPALEQFEADCVLPYLNKEVIGSFAYGSINRDDCNVASDIDYFMIINDEEHKKRIRKATKKALQEKNIYIQTRVIQKHLAEAGFHTLDSSFRQHLELSVAQYGFKGENPLEILAQNNTPFKESLKTSIAIYLMKLNNSFTTFQASEEEYVDFLKDIMEKPFHAMRVAIQYELGAVAPEGDKTFNDTKQELIRIYKTLGYDKELDKDIHKLNATAYAYIKLLEKRQSKRWSSMREDYSEMLDKIAECYSQAFHFIEENAKIIGEKD